MDGARRRPAPAGSSAPGCNAPATSVLWAARARYIARMSRAVLSSSTRHRLATTCLAPRCCTIVLRPSISRPSSVCPPPIAVWHADRVTRSRSREVESGERVERQARAIAQDQKGPHGVTRPQTEMSPHVQHRVGVRRVQQGLEPLSRESAVGKALAGQRAATGGGAATGGRVRREAGDRPVDDIAELVGHARQRLEARHRLRHAKSEHAQG